MEKLYRPLGKTGFIISPVIYGGIVSMKDGQKNSDEYVNWAIEHGIKIHRCPRKIRKFFTSIS